MGALASVTDAYVLARRETTQFFRRPARLISFFVQPLLFLFLFGFGIRAALRPDVGGFDYVLFIIPGLVAQRLITTASRGGMGLIRDRHAGFLKEVLVAPVSRRAVLLGLSFGHVLRTVLQGVLLLGIGVWLGIRFGGGQAAILNAAIVLAIMVLTGLSIMMLSMALAWKMDDAQNFMLVSNYAMFPLFLLSGALFQVEKLPGIFRGIVLINPLTYTVDAMRYFALGPTAAHVPIWLDLMAIGGLFLAALGFAMGVMRTRQAD